MPKRGKKYRDAVANVDRNALHGLEEGVELALKTRYARFDESFDIALTTGR